jgi:ADP-heptose:LPS heptosyltransferase
MRNVLLFRLGGLGDLLVAFPAIHLIRKTFPSAELTLVCREEYGLLLQEAGVVDRVMRGDGPRLLPLFAGSAVPGKELKEWLNGFDLVAGWLQGKSKGALENSLTATSISGERRFFYYPPESREQISRFFFRQTSGVLEGDRPAEFPFDECAKLPPSPAPKKVLGLITKERGRKFVVVHPGSGSEKKCWPVQNFLEIIGRLGQKGVGGIVVTGQAEERMEPLIKRTPLPRGWSWLRSPSLVVLSALLQEADLYLGNDSGITHLAASCGTEVVALFREDLVTAWRPYGRARLLSAGSLEEITIDSVWEMIPF